MGSRRMQHGISDATKLRMIRFLIACLIVLLTVSNASAGGQPLVVQGGATLKWVDNNPPGTAAHFIVQVYSGDKLMASEQVGVIQIEVDKIFGELIPGEYQLRIVTVDQNGVASAPSPAITVLWLGSGLG